MNPKLYLQAVVVSKKLPFEEAEKKALEIMKKRKATHRETKDSYRFRNIPKTKFKPDSYMSKVVNDDITLVMGHMV